MGAPELMFAKSTGIQPLPGVEGVVVAVPMVLVVVGVIQVDVVLVVNQLAQLGVVVGEFHVPVALTTDTVAVATLR